MADCAHLVLASQVRYMQTRGTNSLPEGLSRVKQEKQHSMTEARLGSQKYSLLLSFHRRAQLKQVRSTCFHAQRGEESELPQKLH